MRTKGKKKRKTLLNKSQHKCSSSLIKKTKSNLQHIQKPFTPQPALKMSNWIYRMFNGPRKTRNRDPDEGNSRAPSRGCRVFPDAEKHENVTIITRDGRLKYSCQVRYTTVNTLQCETVPRSKKMSNKVSTTTGPLRRCFVVQRRRVIGWACTRDIDETSWFVVRFSRVPITSRRIGKSSRAIFQGVSYTCTGPPVTKGKKRKPNAPCT